MNTPLTPATHRVSFAIGDEQAARRVADALEDIFFEDQAAIAAFERSDGSWDITLHFADALDLGTGTGVLAMTLAKALRRAVLASDVDPPSVNVARENGRLNHVGNLTRTIRATGFAAPDFAEHGPFDLVLANILANPLRQL